MCPMSIEQGREGGQAYGSPFRGNTDHLASVRLDVSAMTAAEVDAFGYLKPGVPLTRAGVLVGIAPAHVFGCNAEATKVAASNAPADLAAAADRDVGVVVIGVVNRDVLEDILGRALTADEIAGFDRAGSKLVLTNT